MYFFIFLKKIILIFQPIWNSDINTNIPILCQNHSSTPLTKTIYIV